MKFSYNFLIRNHYRETSNNTTFTLMNETLQIAPFLTVDLGTFPRWVMFLLAFSLATLIRWVGAIARRYQLVILFLKKICFWRFAEDSWMPEVTRFMWGVLRWCLELFALFPSGEMEYFLLKSSLKTAFAIWISDDVLTVDCRRWNG